VSPIQFQKRIRLQEARQQLAGSKDDVAQVAYAVGYDSPSQFNREYRRLIGAPQAVTGSTSGRLRPSSDGQRRPGHGPGRDDPAGRGHAGRPRLLRGRPERQPPAAARSWLAHHARSLTIVSTIRVPAAGISAMPEKRSPVWRPQALVRRRVRAPACVLACVRACAETCLGMCHPFV
jgi:hypothetical protein